MRTKRDIYSSPFFSALLTLGLGRLCIPMIVYTALHLLFMYIYQIPYAAGNVSSSAATLLGLAPVFSYDFSTQDWGPFASFIGAAACVILILYLVCPYSLSNQSAIID